MPPERPLEVPEEAWSAMVHRPFDKENVLVRITVRFRGHEARPSVDAQTADAWWYASIADL